MTPSLLNSPPCSTSTCLFSTNASGSQLNTSLNTSSIKLLYLCFTCNSVTQEETEKEKTKQSDGTQVYVEKETSREPKHIQHEPVVLVLDLRQRAA